ncbi:hypothetical protein FHS21_001789 [Phyllobacterium trifolii]|uniref:Uncharacterized protein n=1 Tax=Phyllobacterium trifolii TaxID=300193 RepID=A0A839U5U3_9HYPH|nr:hypothetical protein [Phyllobacterium trifolii]
MEPVLFRGWRDNPRGRWRGRCLSIGRRRMTKWLAASRKPEGPGEFAPNPSGFGFVRWINIGLAKPLALESNSLRQNDSIWMFSALGR